MAQLRPEQFQELFPDLRSAGMDALNQEVYNYQYGPVVDEEQPGLRYIPGTDAAEEEAAALKAKELNMLMMMLFPGKQT